MIRNEKKKIDQTEIKEERKGVRGRKKMELKMVNITRIKVKKE